MISILQQFAFNFPVWYHLIIVIVSLALLAKASYFLVLSISNYAKKLGISEYLVGLLIVAAGASAPEFLASLSGVFYGASPIVFGTIFGSNLLGVTLVIGLLAIVGKKIPMNQKVFDKTKGDVLILIALPFLLLLDGKLTAIDGGVLLVAFIFYVSLLWKREGQLGKLKKGVEINFIWKDSLIFLLSLVVILLASRFLVDSSMQISYIMNWPAFIVATILIGLGASVPDLFLGLNSIDKGHEGVAFGDIIGSMILKSLLFFGIFALMTTLEFGVFNAIFIGILTLASSMLLFYFVKKKSLTRLNGIILILFYIIFLVGQFLFFN